MAKMPAMQFYPADWRKDLSVRSLGYFDRGVWFEMICLMHESDERGVLVLNGLPMADQIIANMLGLDNQTFNQTLSTLLTNGVARRRQSDGAIFNKRMVDDERLCQIRREAGKKGGNPVLLNQNTTTTDNQNPTPSSSSSSSSIKTKTTPEVDLFQNCDPQIIADFKALRTKHRAPITKTAIDGIIREANKAGMSLQDAIRMCCERGWRGFKAEWVDKSMQGGAVSGGSDDPRFRGAK